MIKDFNQDPHYFRGIDGNYYVTKRSLAGIYEVFFITEDVKPQLMERDDDFKKLVEKEEV